MIDATNGPQASRRGMLNGLLGLGALGLAVPTASAGAMRPTDQGRVVYIDDFLNVEQRAAAMTERPLDCTAAFAHALAAGRNVVVGAGHYALDALRLPNESSLTGEGGATIHQSVPDRPAIRFVSDADSGQLADVSLGGIAFVGHPAASAAVVLLEARGGYAIWRSRVSIVTRDCFRALEIQASDANNVFECEIEVVSENTSDTAVLVRGGVYNRFHFFLSGTQGWALDDASSCSSIRVVAENSVIFRGQMNQISAQVEGIAALRAADETVIIDRGFGNVFVAAQVNMQASDAGKQVYAFKAFERSVFVSPQIIGPGAPPHPFAPTSNYPFTIIGGRSSAEHKIEATFNGSDPDHDLRNVTFVGDVRDFTSLATHPGTTTVQRFVPNEGGVAQIAATTRTVIIDAPRALAVLNIAFQSVLQPMNGWILSIATTHDIGSINWPADTRFSRLPRELETGARFDIVYQRDIDAWLRA